jgi:hypothetical protein
MRATIPVRVAIQMTFNTLDHHLHRFGLDESDLATWVDVPARLGTARNIGDHLPDVGSGNRRCTVLSSVRFSFQRARRRTAASSPWARASWQDLLI